MGSRRGHSRRVRQWAIGASKLERGQTPGSQWPMSYPQTRSARFRRVGFPPMHESAESPHAWQECINGNGHLSPVAQGRFVGPNGRGMWFPQTELARIFLPRKHSSPQQHSGAPRAESPWVRRHSSSGASRLGPGRATPPSASYASPEGYWSLMRHCRYSRYSLWGPFMPRAPPSPTYDILHAERNAAAISTPETTD